VFLFFLIYSALEISLLYKFISNYSFWDAFGIMFTTAILGFYILTTQGKAAFMDLQKATQRGVNPASHVVHKLLIALGGLFLIMPGLLGDIIGTLLILPGIRHIVVFIGEVFLIKKIANIFTSNVQSKGFKMHFGNMDFQSFQFGNMGSSKNSETDFRDVTPENLNSQNPQILDVKPTKITHEE
jgi:UPF0716 protein FxsA